MRFIIFWLLSVFLMFGVFGGKKKCLKQNGLCVSEAEVSNITWLVFNRVSFVIGRMRSSEISKLWDIKHQDGAGENWEKDASLRRTSSLSFGDKIALQNCNVIEINRKLWKKKLSCSSYKRHSFISQLYFVCNFVIRNP